MHVVLPLNVGSEIWDRDRQQYMVLAMPSDEEKIISQFAPRGVNKICGAPVALMRP